MSCRVIKTYLNCMLILIFRFWNQQTRRNSHTVAWMPAVQLLHREDRSRARAKCNKINHSTTNIKQYRITKLKSVIINGDLHYLNVFQKVKFYYYSVGVKAHLTLIIVGQRHIVCMCEQDYSFNCWIRYCLMLILRHCYTVFPVESRN